MYQPVDVFNYAMMGLPKIFPLTKEPITVDHFMPFYNNAIVEVEMDVGCNISPVEHTQPFDYIDGCFEANFSGFKLNRWPATQITYMQLKFPHAVTNNIYQKYTIPPQWIALNRNKVNVIAAYGAIAVQTSQTNVATAGGIFSYITGFARGAYQPAIVEIQYKAGFDHDRLPTTLAELLRVWAAKRFLSEVAPLLFPVAGASVALDGVSQSASMPGPSLLVQKIADMDKREKELKVAIKKTFGQTMKFAFVGA